MTFQDIAEIVEAYPAVKKGIIMVGASVGGKIQVKNFRVVLVLRWWAYIIPFYRKSIAKRMEEEIKTKVSTSLQFDGVRYK